MYRRNKHGEVRMVLLGKSGSGKSETANTILGMPGAFKTSPNPESVTKKCQQEIEFRFNKKLIVVDTPGVFGTKDSETVIADEVKTSMIMSSPGPNAILLCVSMARFDTSNLDALNYYYRMFGEDLASFVILVFTHFDEWQRKLKQSDDKAELQRKFIEELPLGYQKFVSDERYVFFNNKIDASLSEVKDQVESLIAKIFRINNGEYYSNEKFEEIEKMLQRGETIAKIKRAALWGSYGALALSGFYGIAAVSASRIAIAGAAKITVNSGPVLQSAAAMAASAGSMAISAGNIGRAAGSMAMSAGTIAMSAGTMAVSAGITAVSAFLRR